MCSSETVTRAGEHPTKPLDIAGRSCAHPASTSSSGDASSIFICIHAAKQERSHGPTTSYAPVAFPSAAKVREPAFTQEGG
jgi:hypothetical protein